MKKRIMAAIVAVSVMMFGTTAFAAGSPEAGSTKADTTVAADQIAATEVEAPTESVDSMAKSTTVETAGVDVKPVGKTTVDDAVVATKNLLNDVKALGDTLGNKDLADAAGIATKTVKATVLGVVNLESQLAVKEITIKNDAIKAGKTYAVLHFTNGKWVTLPAKVTADKTLSFTVDNLSPFAIVEIDVVDKSATANGSNPAATTPSTTTPAADNKADQAASPKTGETMPVAVLALLVCATGAVVCAKKKEN